LLWSDWLEDEPLLKLLLSDVPPEEPFALEVALPEVSWLPVVD